jgi:phage terminase large subunit-like protein
LCSNGKTAEKLIGLTAQEYRQLEHDWFALLARDDQKPPSGNWRSWLILGGRGSGKTRSGAEWVRARATGQGFVSGPLARRIALVAPTFDEARMVMIEGVSGLLSIHDDTWRPEFEPSKRLLTWPNGCVAQVFTAEEPDGLRGPQFDAAWCDELAKWKHAESAWDMLSLVVGLSVSLGAAAAKLFPFLLTPGH